MIIIIKWLQKKKKTVVKSVINGDLAVVKLSFDDNKLVFNPEKCKSVYHSSKNLSLRSFL